MCERFVAELRLEPVLRKFDLRFTDRSYHRLQPSSQFDQSTAGTNTAQATMAATETAILGERVDTQTTGTAREEEFLSTTEEDLDLASIFDR